MHTYIYYSFLNFAISAKRFIRAPVCFGNGGPDDSEIGSADALEIGGTGLEVGGAGLLAIGGGGGGGGGGIGVGTFVCGCSVGSA